MSKEKYISGCAGCRPALLDLKTNKPLPADDPIMICINATYDTLSESEKEAFHNFCCLNEHTKAGFSVMQKLQDVVKGRERND